MSKEDIINYVMTTPGNPNKAVLEGILDDVGETGGTAVYQATVETIGEAYRITLHASYNDIINSIGGVMHLIEDDAESFAIIGFWGVREDRYFVEINDTTFTASTATDNLVSEG